MFVGAISGSDHRPGGGSGMAASVRAGIRHLLSRIAASPVPVSPGCGAAAAAAAAQGLGFGRMTGLAAIAAHMRGLCALPVEVEAFGSESTSSAMAAAARPYVKTKKLTKQAKHIMQLLDREAMDTAVKERSIPRIKPGDIVQLKVEVPENKRRVSQLKGIVIAKRNAGISSTIRIRRVLAGVGVEVVYPLYSPNIKEIKVISSRKVRRAKLYYLRDKIAKLSTF